MNTGSTLVVIRREVKDTFTDWRIMLPMLVLALLFPGILVASIGLSLPYMERIDPGMAQGKASLFGAAMSAFFPISFSLVIALESFAGEKERNTLEALLVSPMSDAEIFFGKFIAVLIPPTFLSMVGLFVFTVGTYVNSKIMVPADFLVLSL
ncbi:MAG: ABC transporter permease subunit, partial [Chloroflexota bacterium]